MTVTVIRQLMRLHGQRLVDEGFQDPEACLECCKTFREGLFMAHVLPNG